MTSRPLGIRWPAPNDTWLEQSASQDSMYLDGAADDPFRDWVDRFELCVSVSLWLIHLCPPVISMSIGGKRAATRLGPHARSAGTSRGRIRTRPHSADRARPRGRSGARGRWGRVV